MLKSDAKNWGWVHLCVAADHQKLVFPRFSEPLKGCVMVRHSGT